MKASLKDGASCADHIDRLLDEIAQRDGVVRAYCEVLTSEARANAARLDQLPPDQRGALHGTGIGIKEVFDVAGGLCGWGSTVHEGRRPDDDADIVAALRAAGGVVLGTTTSTEYAMARKAPTTNPYDSERTPGASSSGSAAAVAAGMADIAIGSQSIGSGIRPAAYCGVIGFKPTQGALSLKGAMPLAETLDHPVIFAGDMALISKSFEVLAASQSDDAVDLELKSQAGTAGRKVRVALVSPWFKDAVDADVWEMVRSFAEVISGIECTAVTLPDEIGAREEGCLTAILSTGMWHHHGADYAKHSDKMSENLRVWLERGRDIAEQDYRAALGLRDDISAGVWQALQDYDFVITLSTTDTAPLLSDGTGSRAPQRLWTLIGSPAISGPIGKIGGLPVGLQIVGRRGSDRALLDFASHAFSSSGR